MPFSFCKELNSQQRAALKAKAHSLKPSVQMGEKGLSETVIAEIKQVLDHHELIKIKLSSSEEKAQDKKEALDALLAILPPHSHFVGRLGRTVILYLEKHPEEAKLSLADLK
jgi:RNA-binding protein